MASKSENSLDRVGALKSGRSALAVAGGKPDDPLYLQLVHALKQEIVSGVHPVGSRLPSEEELCERFSVSRYTVREALRRLREDHLVSSRQGAGTVVVPPRPSGSYVHEVMSINDLVAYAAGVRFSIDAIDMIVADAKLAERIGVAVGEEWLFVRGFRHTDGIEPPVCWTEVYINREFAAVGRLLQRNNGPIFHLIEDLFGQSIVEVQQEIAVALVSPALSQGLKVKAESTALEVRRTYRLASAKIVQIAISTHPAARFRHSMTMRRIKG